MRTRALAALALAALLALAASPAPGKLCVRAVVRPENGRVVDAYRVAASRAAPAAAGVGPCIRAESVGAVPIAPLLLPIANDDGDPDYGVDWDDVPGASTYTLEEDADPAFPAPSVRYAGPDSYYGIRYQPLGTWHYRVRASDEAGDGPWSNVESVGVTNWLPAPSLDPISNPEADGDFLVRWSYVRGAQVYELQEGSDPGFSSPVLRYLGPDLSFAVTGQPQGTWYYHVRAEGGPGNSPYSNVEVVRVWPSVSYLPMLLRAR